MTQLSASRYLQPPVDPTDERLARLFSQPVMFRINQRAMDPALAPYGPLNLIQRVTPDDLAMAHSAINRHTAEADDPGRDLAPDYDPAFDADAYLAQHFKDLPDETKAKAANGGYSHARNLDHLAEMVQLDTKAARMASQLTPEQQDEARALAGDGFHVELPKGDPDMRRAVEDIIGAARGPGAAADTADAIESDRAAAETTQAVLGAVRGSETPGLDIRSIVAAMKQDERRTVLEQRDYELARLSKALHPRKPGSLQGPFTPESDVPRNLIGQIEPTDRLSQFASNVPTMIERAFDSMAEAHGGAAMAVGQAFASPMATGLKVLEYAANNSPTARLAKMLGRPIPIPSMPPDVIAAARGYDKAMMTISGPAQAGDMLRDWGQQVMVGARENARVNLSKMSKEAQTPYTPEWFASEIINTSPLMAEALATGILTGGGSVVAQVGAGAITSGIFEGGVIASDVYEQEIQAGRSKQDAYEAAMISAAAYAPVAAAVEVLPFSEYLTGGEGLISKVLPGPKWFKHFIAGSIGEGIEEPIQGTWQDVVNADVTRTPMQSGFWSRRLQETVVGTAAGMATSTATAPLTLKYRGAPPVDQQSVQDSMEGLDWADRVRQVYAQAAQGHGVTAADVITSREVAIAQMRANGITDEQIADMTFEEFAGHVAQAQVQLLQGLNEQATAKAEPQPVAATSEQAKPTTETPEAPKAAEVKQEAVEEEPPKPAGSRQGRIRSIGESSLTVGGKTVKGQEIGVIDDEGTIYRIQVEGNVSAAMGQTIEIPDGAEVVSRNPILATKQKPIPPSQAPPAEGKAQQIIEENKGKLEGKQGEVSGKPADVEPSRPNLERLKELRAKGMSLEDAKAALKQEQTPEGQATRLVSELGLSRTEAKRRVETPDEPPDEFAQRANARGLAEGQFQPLPGVNALWQPVEVAPGQFNVVMGEDGFPEGRPEGESFSWAEAVAEADRRTLEANGYNPDEIDVAAFRNQGEAVAQKATPNVAAATPDVAPASPEPTPIIRSPIRESFAAVGPGHAQFADSLDALVAEGTIGPASADLILTVLQNTDDETLARFSLGSSNELRFVPRQRRAFDSKKPFEPWEMTREEYQKQEYDAKVASPESYTPTGLPRLSSREFYDRQNQKKHQRIVESALKANKPVPAEVLDDYPVLREKAIVQRVGATLVSKPSSRAGSGATSINKRRVQILIARKLATLTPNSSPADIHDASVLLEEMGHGLWGLLKTPEDEQMVKAEFDRLGEKHRIEYFRDGIAGGDNGAAEYAQSNIDEFVAHLFVEHALGRRLPVSPEVQGIIQRLVKALRDAIARVASRGYMKPEMITLLDRMLAGESAPIQPQGTAIQRLESPNSERIGELMQEQESLTEQLAELNSSIGTSEWPKVRKFYRDTQTQLAQVQGELASLGGIPAVLQRLGIAQSDLRTAAAFSAGLPSPAFAYGAKQYLGGFEKAHRLDSMTDAEYKQAVDGYRAAKAGASDIQRQGAEFLAGQAGRDDTETGLLFGRAFHGSPYTFDRFSSDKIGTGEGAQAYGHGLYFSSRRGVAEWYQEKLAGSKEITSIGPMTREEVQRLPDWMKNEIRRNSNRVDDGMIRQFIGSLRERQYEIGRMAAEEDSGSSQFADEERERYKLIQSVIDSLQKVMKSGDFKVTTAKGRLYEVELAPKEDEYLLWDRPLSEQSETVKKALTPEAMGLALKTFDNGYMAFVNNEGRAIGNMQKGGTPESYRKHWVESLLERRNGGEAYKYLSANAPSASAALHKAGIRGIKYLDATSRNKPLNDIKRSFLDALPEDATPEEVNAMLGDGTFTPEQDAFLKALAADDWLGFDYAAQAISAALSNNISNYDASEELRKSIEGLRQGETFNYVIFNDADVQIKQMFGRELPTDTPEFKAWFGKSKVVDENGEPRVVYHGTPDARGLAATNVFQTREQQFASVLTADARARSDEEAAYFFTSDERTAKSYADDRRAFDYQGAEPGVSSYYVSIKNPKIIDAAGKGWGKRGGAAAQQEQIAQAKADGHDGLIIRNTRDTYEDTASAPLATVVVAFRPEQIKSATGNVGTFDPNNPDIRFGRSTDDLAGPPSGPPPKPGMSEAELPPQRPRVRIDPENYRPAKRSDITDQTRIGAALHAPTLRIQLGVGKMVERFINQRPLPLTTIAESPNAGVVAVGNILDHIGPLTGHGNAAGIYSGSRAQFEMDYLRQWNAGAQDIRDILDHDLTAALSDHAFARGTLERLGFRGLQNTARKMRQFTATAWQRMTRLERAITRLSQRRLDLMRLGENATPKQKAELAQIPAKMDQAKGLRDGLREMFEREMTNALGDNIDQNAARKAIEDAYAKFGKLNEELARREMAHSEAAPLINARLGQAASHAVVSLNADYVDGSAGLDRLMRMIYGVTEKQAEQNAPVQVGNWYMVMDRRNYGQAIEVDVANARARIKWYNKTKGTSAIGWKKFDELTPATRGEVGPVAPGVDGAVEFKDSAYWKRGSPGIPPLDPDNPADLKEIVRHINNDRIGFNLDPETPYAQELVSEPAVRFDDLETRSYIAGKRRQAIDEFFLNAAKRELGLWDQPISTWDALLQTVRLSATDMGMNLNDPRQRIINDSGVKMLRTMIDFIFEHGRSAARDHTVMHSILGGVAESIKNYTIARSLRTAYLSVGTESSRLVARHLSRSGMPRAVIDFTKALYGQIREMTPLGRERFRAYWQSFLSTTNLSHRNRANELAGLDPVTFRRMAREQEMMDSMTLSGWMLGGLPLAVSREAANYVTSGRVAGGKYAVPFARHFTLEEGSLAERRASLAMTNSHYMRILPSLLDIHNLILDGTARHAGDAIRQLKAQGRLPIHIDPHDYIEFMQRVSGAHLAKLVDRIRKREDIGSIMGMDYFEGNDPEAKAYAGYLDYVGLRVNSATPNAMTRPITLQEDRAYSGIARFLLMFRSWAMADAAQSGRLARTQSSGRNLAVFSAQIGSSLAIKFIRTMIYFGFGALAWQKWEEGWDKDNATQSILDLLGYANVWGPSEVVMQPLLTSFWGDDWRREQLARGNIHPASGAIEDVMRTAMYTLPKAVDPKRSLTAADWRRLRRATVITNTFPFYMWPGPLDEKPEGRVIPKGLAR